MQCPSYMFFALRIALSSSWNSVWFMHLKCPPQLLFKNKHKENNECYIFVKYMILTHPWRWKEKPIQHFSLLFVIYFKCRTLIWGADWPHLSFGKQGFQWKMSTAFGHVFFWFPYNIKILYVNKFKSD